MLLYFYKILNQVMVTLNNHPQLQNGLLCELGRE